MTTELPPCTLHQISEHVWWFTPESRTDRPSLCAVVGDNQVVLLDIGASPTHTQQFVSELAKQGIALPDYAVLTHWHWDHVFGMAALNCPIIAHEETAQHIERMMSLDYGDGNLPNLVAQGHEVEFTREHMVLEMSNAQRQGLVLRKPEITFRQFVGLNLQGVTCEIHHVGGDHASDSVVMVIPEDKVLFLGDCFYYTVYETPQHFTKSKVLPLIDKLSAFSAEIVVMGHNNQLLSQAELYQEFGLIRDTYALLDEHGEVKRETIQDTLLQSYDTDDVAFYLETIVAGLAFDR